MRLSRIVPILAFGFLGLSALRADIVILKDGTTLHGKLKQGTDLIFEKDFGVMQVPKGFHFVDDDVRKIAFPFRLIPNADAIDTKDTLKGPGVEIIQNKVVRLNSLALENGLGTITQITPWNEKAERTVTFLTNRGPETVKQKIWVMTPHAVLIQADRYRWVASYLTRELGVEQIRKLLYDHPDLRDKDGVVDPAKRMRIFRFLMQAGWYEEAGVELDQLLKALPGEKMRVDEARKILQSFQAQHDYDELVQGQKAGRHEWVLKRLPLFPREAASEKLLLQFQTLQREYEVGQETIAAARRYLNSLLPMVSPEEHRLLFADAVAAILAELNFDNHERLRPFVVHARQAEALRQKGQAATDGPNELLALAVSGWLLGNGLADPEVPAAIKLWKVRQHILTLQKMHQEAGRQALIVQIERLGVVFDLVPLIVRTLPPPEPEEKLPELGGELRTKLQGRAQPITYYLNLPREYHHGRPYPVLFVLNDGSASPQDTLNYWADHADKNGYILVAVDRTSGGKRPTYGYTADEHALVLDTLRDLQNRFNVDTDRVFLTGTGEAAAMAYDVGLSHPDRFAGVVPICGLPRLFTMAYSSNGQHLPFYVICGDLAPPDYPKAIRRQFETWTTRVHPSLYVEYRGRGLEWFTGELPYLFEWMGRKTRDNAAPDTGEFCSMRPGDTRFYWLSGEGIDPRHFNHAASWSHTVRPATLWGKIHASNQISVMSKGYKQVSVWLGPGMIDWNGEVSVSINTNSRIRDKKLKPSLATLLEDFYQRGDRQRLFFLKLDLVP